MHSNCYIYLLGKWSAINSVTPLLLSKNIKAQIWTQENNDPMLQGLDVNFSLGVRKCV